MRATSTVPILAATVAAQSSAGPYGQCGGMGWSGPVACQTGYYCYNYNPYYSQCIPGSATTSSTSSTSRTPTTTAITYITPPTPTTLSTITTSTATTGNGGSIPPVPTTLVSPNYWIRAVAAPNYRKYLQPKSGSSLQPGKAVIASNLSASQFQLTASDGQLTLYRGVGIPPLYLNIENPADKTQRKLATEFKETKNSYGKFGFQGDTLIWSTSDIKRPNEAAWLVCTGQELFVNTGAYGWDTPAGCSDQTIHSYGGATADT